MSVTSLLVSFSLVIPSIYGIDFCNEKMTLLKATGFALLLVALVVFNIKKFISKTTPVNIVMNL